MAVRAGARWVATNTDRTLPSGRGPLPGNGSLVAVLRTALGRDPDVVVGKPEPALFATAARRAGAGRTLVVGDRLDTDIEGARRAGLDSLLVLTGVERRSRAAGRRPRRAGPRTSRWIWPGSSTRRRVVPGARRAGGRPAAGRVTRRPRTAAWPSERAPGAVGRLDAPGRRSARSPGSRRRRRRRRCRTRRPSGRPARTRRRAGWPSLGLTVAPRPPVGRRAAAAVRAACAASAGRTGWP